MKVTGNSGATEAVQVKNIVGKLSLIDRFLPIWIFSAMALGVMLGKAFPGIGPALDAVKVADVSLWLKQRLFPGEPEAPIRVPDCTTGPRTE